MDTSPPAAPPQFGTDQSLGLLRHGYQFWELLRARRAQEVVQARLLHERVTVVRGAEAATFFYEEPDTERSSALPKSLVGPLFGQGAVHTLDGPPHAHRKALFNDHLTAYAVADVVADVTASWDTASFGEAEFGIYDDVAPILFRAGCRWVGLDIQNAETRTKDMVSMVDGFGAPTLRQLRARMARRRTNAWVAEQVRESRRSPAGDSVVDAVARHRDASGKLLDERTAAVEIINLVRPLVAVSWLVAGLARAFDSRPDVREDVLAERVSAMEVAQEVRRTAPFVPFLATRATRDLTWDGAIIPAGTLLVMDVWGTNHDSAVWHDPHRFNPMRFRTTPVTPYNLIPQGGGDRHTGHRCPGEDLTLAVLIALVPRVAALRARVIGDGPGLRRMPPEPACTLRIVG